MNKENLSPVRASSRLLRRETRRLLLGCCKCTKKMTTRQMNATQKEIWADYLSL